MTPHVRIPGSVLLVALLAGLCPTAAPADFPLKVSANRRYLVNRNGLPVLVQGEAAWSLITGVTKQEAERYLDDRRRKGFNAIIVNLIEHKFQGPVNREGEGPFTTPGDFATPNEKYFAHADWVLRQAADRGMAVFLFPAYLGYKGLDEGWYQEVLLNGTARCRDYGRFLGRRYQGYANIVWSLGGDRNPDLAEEAEDAIAAGIKEFMPDALFTAHAAGESSAAERYSASWLDINTTYTYGIVHQLLARDYSHRPVMPYLLMETTYEGEHNASPVQIRRQAYWALLSGAAGQFFGNRPIWGFFPGWQAALDSQGSADMVHVPTVFLARPWNELVPDLDHKVAIDGLGEFHGLDYATAARTADRRTVIVYLPTPRTVTIDTSGIAGVRQHAWWFDPRTGRILRGREFAGGGKESFAPPGDGDWLLVVEDAGIEVPGGG